MVTFSYENYEHWEEVAMIGEAPVYKYKVSERKRASLINQPTKYHSISLSGSNSASVRLQSFVPIIIYNTPLETSLSSTWWREFCNVPYRRWLKVQIFLGSLRDPLPKSRLD